MGLAAHRPPLIIIHKRNRKGSMFVTCLLLLLAACVDAYVNPDAVFIDDDTVMVQAEDVSNSVGSRAHRLRRQWPGASWPGSGWPGSGWNTGVHPIGVQPVQCRTNGGYSGHCVTLKQCYPALQFRDILGSKQFYSWLPKLTDTCSMLRQGVGVCCPSSGLGSPTVPTHRPPTQPPLVTHPPLGQWPPPIPTHPPNHTPATHPPFQTQRPVYPGWPPSTSTTTTTTTRRPPNYPWWSSTTQRPWPPYPTQSTTHRPIYPWLTTSSTQSPWTTRPPPTQPPTGGGQCGVTRLVTARGEAPVDEELVTTVDPPTNITDPKEKIVGGVESQPNQWPWIVSIQAPGNKHFCGGSVIDTKYVLTAAHCVYKLSQRQVANLVLKFGAHDISTPYETQSARVSRIYWNRGFNEHTLLDDVAVMVLQSPIQYSSTVKPVCMPTGSDDYQGRTAYVAGWGSIREGGNVVSRLRHVDITVWSNQRCREAYGTTAPGGINSGHLCGKKPGKDSCVGDSGGPLMTQEGQFYTQIGLVSFGIGCGTGLGAHIPGVYSRLSYYLPWINRNIEKDRTTFYS